MRFLIVLLSLVWSSLALAQTSRPARPTSRPAIRAGKTVRKATRRRRVRRKRRVRRRRARRRSSAVRRRRARARRRSRRRLSSAKLRRENARLKRELAQLKAKKAKSAAQVKVKKQKAPFNRKAVPVGMRPYPEGGLLIGLGLGYTSGSAASFNLGGDVGGYFCGFDGKLCGQAGVKVSFYPLGTWGGWGGFRWHPWSSRSWLSLGLDVTVLSVPRGPLSVSTRWTFDPVIAVDWRIFGDIALTRIRFFAKGMFGADSFQPYPFSPNQHQFTAGFYAGFQFVIDFSQRYRNGNRRSIFTGTSPYRPTPGTPYQNLVTRRFQHATFDQNGVEVFRFRGRVFAAQIDSDGDGLLNKYDLCPLRRGPVQQNGCPVSPRDSDGDGVPDYRDKHPLNWRAQ